MHIYPHIYIMPRITVSKYSNVRLTRVMAVMGTIPDVKKIA